MISISEEPQFSAEDIYEIPAGFGRTSVEFDTNLIKACHPLFQTYHSNDKLANDLIRAQVILKSDTNLSTQDALILRFKTRKVSLSFIHRLNTYLHKCCKNGATGRPLAAEGGREGVYRLSREGISTE